jgi:hypothetical protein
VLKEKYLGNSDNRTRWFDVVPSSLRFPTNPHTSLYRLDLDVPFSSFTHATHQQTTLVMLVLPTECLNRITADPKRGIETDHLYTQSEILLLLPVPGTPFPSHVTSFARTMQVKCSPLLTLVVHSPCMTSGIYSSTLSYGHRINDYPVYNRPLLDICTDREPDGMPNPFINQYIILAVACRFHYRSRHSLSDSEGS